MMKCLYILSVVFQMAAGCALSGDNNWLKITGHKGGSMLLPCSCFDLHSKPQRFTWESDRTGYLAEVFNNKQYNDRFNLFNNTSPANLSLFISDLREEDQGVYRCSTEKEHRFIWLYVKGCELVKKTVVEEVTGFTGESVVLPCICTDLQDDPKTVTWELNNIKIYSEQTGHHSNRIKLVSNNLPGNLSLLISDLTREDQGTYRCSVQDDHRDFRLYVKVRRRETSTEWMKTDTTTSSEQTQSKPTTSPPASSSTTQGGRLLENVNVEGHQDCKGKQEDQVTAGCALSVKNHIEITQHKGRSVLLPCSCSDLLSKPQKFTWETFRTGRLSKVLNDEHYRGRYQLFNNISPANLSLLISDLREKDEGIYRCSTEKEHRDTWLYVKGCELVKKTGVEKVTGFIGESVVLPCFCTDLQDDPKRVTWKFNKNNHLQEIYSKQTGNHSNRVKLVSKNPPGNLSLLISDLAEEDQGFYKCSAQADHRDLRLSVKGRRKSSIQRKKKKTDTATPSEHPQSKRTTSPPVSSSTTQGGRCIENGVAGGHHDCEGKQEDQGCQESLGGPAYCGEGLRGSVWVFSSRVNEVCPTLVGPMQALVLGQKVRALLKKWAIKVVPSSLFSALTPYLHRVLERGTDPAVASGHPRNANNGCFPHGLGSGHEWPLRPGTNFSHLEPFTYRDGWMSEQTPFQDSGCHGPVLVEARPVRLSPDCAALRSSGKSSSGRSLSPPGSTLMAGGTLVHPRLELWKLWLWPLREVVRRTMATVSVTAPIGDMFPCRLEAEAWDVTQSACMGLGSCLVPPGVCEPGMARVFLYTRLGACLRCLRLPHDVLCYRHSAVLCLKPPTRGHNARLCPVRALGAYLHRTSP
ncbi:hypothetical protein C0J50_6598 [Silurus asotus]|uniref:Ig-like domain-containing protein n=1 Tax=Silurus asotus TaxID=30991 RepID=A0AAD5FAJ5_SILAS|nr:hypothetical protein C0J50_6598 [Silurus asotus]